jgi:hypothetical protein
MQKTEEDIEALGQRDIVLVGHIATEVANLVLPAIGRDQSPVACHLGNLVDHAQRDPTLGEHIDRGTQENADFRTSRIRRSCRAIR